MSYRVKLEGKIFHGHYENVRPYVRDYSLCLFLVVVVYMIVSDTLHN